MKVRYRIISKDYKFYLQRKILFRWTYVYEEDNGKNVKICREQKYSMQNIVFERLEKYDKKDKGYVIVEYATDRKGVYYLKGTKKVYINTSYRFAREDCV